MQKFERSAFMIRAGILLAALLGCCQTLRAQGQPVIFSATGDVPYGTSEVGVFQTQLDNHNKYSPSAFFVHVGDIFTSGQCSESNYSLVANMLKGLAVPVYIVPGDNETTDCSNPSQGFDKYMQWFENFEQNFCGTPHTEYQSTHPENWAFTMNGVLFVGINLVYGGTSGIEKAADWVKQQLEEEGSQVRAAIFFAHYAPDQSTTFSTPFRQAAASFGKPVLFIHGHGHSWSMNYPFPEKNILRVQVNNGGAEDPIEVTVTMNTSSPANAFAIKRKPWTSKTIVNMPPCVNAGPDQTLASSVSTTLQGSATDDGDPDPPGAITVSWSQVSGPGTVTFGRANALATSVSFNAGGVYLLRLTANDGELQNSDEVTVTVVNPTTITSFTPTTGPVGTEVTITGIDFTGVTQVAFNGVPANNFIVDSETQLRADVPTGALTGTISITNATGTCVSAADFTVTSDDAAVFFPLHDTYVKFSTPTSNYGSGSSLRQQFGSDIDNTYLKFEVTGITRPVLSAKLRLYVINASNDGGALYVVSNNYQSSTIPWTENGMNWDNAPVISGTPLSAAGVVSVDTWVELDVTPAITGNGVYSFGLRSNSSDRVYYSSKEGTNPPALIIEMPPASSTTPTISSFTPVSGPVGTVVTIVGNNFTSATGVAFAGTTASSFIVDSNTQLRATVPAGATIGKISVTNSTGTGLSATDFTVIQPPAIASFTPSSAPVGMFVTIAGTNFTTVTGVAFNGTAATGFIVDSSTQLRASVPAGASTGKISVTNSVGTGLSATNFIVTAPPTITSFTPTNGSAGTQVTMSGSKFTGVTNVTFNGTTATSFTVDSDTQLRAIVPGAVSTGKISVTNTAGSGLSADIFTIIAMPAIGSFTPANGSVGTSVTISGNNFIAITGVAFNGITATSFTVDSGTQIRAAVPSGASTGKISVTNTAGTGLSASDFVVTAIPSIAAFVPATGPVGTAVTITGSNFVGVTSVAFNGLAATSFIVDSNTQLRATVPTGANTGKIGVTNTAGTGVSATNFTITVPPTIVSFTPAGGPVGTSVTITGDNFVGTTSVVFNGTAATGFIIDSNTQLRASVPVAATTGKIGVTNSTGTTLSAVDFVVTTIPFISSFTPTSSPIGVEVTVSGSNFTGVTNVAFNGTAASSFIVDSNVQLRAKVPLNATTGKISVTNVSGTSLSANPFTVTGPILTFYPAEDAEVKSSSPTTNYGTNTIFRLRDGSVKYNSYLKFIVSGLSAPVQRATLRLYVNEGSDDGGAIYLVSNTFAGSSVSWDERSIVWNNAPVIDGVPLHRIDGPVSANTWVEMEMTAAITADGVYSFGMINNSTTNVKYSSKQGGNPPELVLEMSLSSAPAITSFTPTAGTAGTVVTVTGHNFTDIASMTFNGTTAGFIIDSPMQLRATVPQGATTGKIRIINSSGSGLSATDFVVAVSPAITFFTPSSGQSGLEVTIAGSGFAGVTTVAFNGAAASNFDVSSDTQLRVTVPPDATTGKISLANAAGTALSPTDFTLMFSPPLVFTPMEDAEVKSSSPTTNYGANTILRLRDGSVLYNSYLKFAVVGLSQPVRRATLRLHVDEGSDDAGEVYLVSNNYSGGLSGSEWTEAGLVWDNAPAIAGAPLSRANAAANPGTWVELEVTAAITGEGIYSFGLINNSTTNVKYSSKEGSSPPQLVIELRSPSAPAISSFSPTSGAAGTQVTITGSNFSGAMAVTFNGVAAATFTVDSSTQLRAVVPNGATSGKLGVTTTSGGGLSAASFTVILPATTQTFTPLHDAYVRLSSPTQNFGSTLALLQRATATEAIYTYLKFEVTDLAAPVQSAKLRLYVTNASDDGGSVYLVSNHYQGTTIAWSETNLNWSNAPLIGGTALQAAGAVSVDNWIELDVTSAIAGNGIYSFGLKNNSSDAVNYGSKESANPPALVVISGSSSSAASKLAEENPQAAAPALGDNATAFSERLALFPNHPNPFNAQTIIEYTLPLASTVEVVIFNSTGQAVRRLVRGMQPAGPHRVIWDGKDERGQTISSGVYYYHLKAGREILVKQMSIIK